MMDIEHQVQHTVGAQPWWPVRKSGGTTQLLPAPVDGQVLPDGHQQTGGPVLPDALVGPRCR